jgi:hypothetical protein
MTIKRSITRVCHWACSLSGKAAQIDKPQPWRLRHPVLHSVRDLDLPLYHPVVEETIIERIGGRCAEVLSHPLTQAGNEHSRTTTKGDTSVSKEAPLVHASGDVARRESAQCVLWRACKHFTDGSQLLKFITVSQEWIVQRLSIRGPGNVTQQLRRFDWMTTRPKLPPELGEFPYEAGKDGVWHLLFLVGKHFPYCRSL